MNCEENLPWLRSPAPDGRSFSSEIMLAVVLTMTLGVTTKFAQIAPLKAAMLTKSWIGLLAEVDQKVGVVPELGGTSVGVKRFGPELERRTLCKRQFERFFTATQGLALADKSDYPAAKRELVETLNFAGKPRGPNCNTYALLSNPAVMMCVEQLPEEWNVLFLCVNPTERNLERIAAAERDTLTELRALLPTEECTLRIEASTVAALAGSGEALGLSPLDDGKLWFRVAP